MIKGTHDNILDLVKFLEEQKLQFVLSVWAPKLSTPNNDTAIIYTSFEKNEIKKLIEALKDSQIIAEEPQPKNVNKNKI